MLSKRRRTADPNIIAKRRRVAIQSRAIRRRKALNVIGMETKFLNSELTTTATTTTWSSLNPAGTGCTDSISVPAQGDGEQQRDGRQYAILSVHVRGFATLGTLESQTAPDTSKIVRVILYQDTQTNGAEATATDIMDGSQSNDWLSFRNLQNSRRFKVLKDETILFTPQMMNEGAVNLFASGGITKLWNMDVTFKKPIIVNCTGTTANVTSVADNNLGLAFVSSSTSVNIAYQARIRFQG